MIMNDATDVEAPQLDRFQLGETFVLPDRNALKRGDTTLTIEPRVMAVLCLLAQTPREVVTRDAMIAGIWGVENGGDDSVNRAVSVLRKSLTEINGPGDYIQTVPKRGYRLLVEVSPASQRPRGDVISQSAAPGDVATDLSVAERSGVQPNRFDPTASDQAAVERRSRISDRVRWVLASAALLLATSLGVLFFTNSKTELAPATPSIAVLPFSTFSASDGDELLAASVHEALMTSLQKIDSLRVISRTSTRRYADTSLRIPQIADELGVTWIVEGALTREGQKVRISANLIDGRTDSTVWAQRYERPLDASGVFAIQGSIARNVTGELSSVLAPGAGVVDNSPPTQNIDAYRAYLLAKRHIEARDSESLAEGVRKLKKAIELDPYFAEAYAELSMAYSLQSSHSNLTRTELNDLAMPLAQRALELAPGLAEAHTAVADLRSLAGDWDGAESSYQRAIQLNPNYARARQWYAIGLMSDGRVAEALEEHRAAREIDPLSVMLTLNVAQDLFFLGRTEEALAEYEYALEVDPEFTPTYTHLANIYRSSLARHDLAIKWLLDAYDADPRHTEYPSALGAVYLELERPDLARSWSSCAMEIGATQYWPNRTAMLVALHDADMEGIIRHATLINERQPDALLPLTALRDYFLEHQDFDSARTLFTRGFPELMQGRPEVSQYNYPAALALAYFFQQSGEVQRATKLFELVEPFTRDHTRTLEMGADVADVELLALTGQSDAAVLLLENAIDNNWRRHWWYLERNQHLQSLHQDARFQSIIAQLKQQMRPLREAAQIAEPAQCGAPS